MKNGLVIADAGPVFSLAVIAKLEKSSIIYLNVRFTHRIEFIVNRHPELVSE